MKAREIKISDRIIGGDHPILVQSMCNTLTSDVKATVAQINRLEEFGCEVIRVSVPDMESAAALKEIKKHISIPLVADIHFDYRLALEAIKYVDKLRINPGNIGQKDKVAKVINAAKERMIPIRIGVNLGSLDKDIEKDYGLTPQAMVKSAEKHIAILEENNFTDIVVSLKSSDVIKMIEANRLFAEKFDFPLHLGVTEAGSLFSGTIKNSIGIGILLEQGIGSTIRVSLAGDPADEVRAGWQILKALKIRKRGIEVIACPTCARAGIDVAAITDELEDKTKHIKKNLHIAVMGCVVNGPGEAKEADIGVVGADDCCLLYEKGEFVKKIDKSSVVTVILNMVDTI